MLSKKQILSAPDIKSELVDVPEWGGEVKVCGLSGAQRGELEASILEIKDQSQTVRLQSLKVRMCSLAIRDENDRRMFDDDELGDLGAKSAQAIERIYTVAARLSGMDKSEVEKLAKNSAAASGASGSGSPAI